MAEKLKEQTADIVKLNNVIAATFVDTWGGYTNWAPDDIDKLEIEDINSYHDVVDECRFFYKRDPIASTVINKLVEIGITELHYEQNDVSDNEFRVFEGLQDTIQKFIESCALEYLVTGLIVPEIEFRQLGEEKLKELGVKKRTTLSFPVKMWLRDPKTIEIKSPMVMDEPSYFVVLPEELIFFIQNKGTYADGTEDIDLYNEIKYFYPEFVKQVEAGNKKVLLENELIARRKVLAGCEFPIPYLYPALESLKHKRNLRRMDYSIASRVISAIQLFRLGNDEFPITEDDEDAFDDLKKQMLWRNSADRSVEKIFQLFANHTLQIDWVMPEASTLLDVSKYAEINQDIFFALGFPRILTTGETERTQTSNPEFAVISPTKTMENMQKKVLPIARNIIYNVATKNKFKDIPTIRFKKVNLNKLVDFIVAWNALYDSGNLSREDYLEPLGFNFEEQMKKRKKEEDLMEELGIPAFQPAPFSPQPEIPGTENKETTQKTDNKVKE
jgi:hypothetical protein